MVADSHQLNSETNRRNEVAEGDSRIPEQSRRELLRKLRNAAIAIPVATALALKSETAFPY